MSLRGEMVAATLGVLTPDKATESTLNAAAGLVASWEKRLSRWLLAPKMREYEPDTAPGWLVAYHQLQGEPNYDAIFEAMARTHPEDAAEAEDIIRNARALLLERYPAIVLDEIGGNVPIPPSEDMAGDWAACVSVIDNIDRLIDEIEFGCVEPKQIEWVRLAYPELHTTLHQIFGAMLNEADQAGNEIPWDRQDVIRRLAFLPESKQPAEELPPEQDIPEPKKGRTLPSDELTAVQRQDARSL